MKHWGLTVGQSLGAAALAGVLWAGAPDGKPAPDTAMSQDSIIEFLERTQKAAPLLVELKNGVVVQGTLKDYDEQAERLWVVVPNSDSLFHQRSIRLKTIHRLQETPRESDAAPDSRYRLIQQESKE